MPASELLSQKKRSGGRMHPRAHLHAACHPQRTFAGEMTAQGAMGHSLPIRFPVFFPGNKNLHKY